MDWWVQAAEISSRFGLLVGGALGLYLAWLRVTAANRQAEAQIRQADASARQADLGQLKLVAELLSQAVAQMRDEKLEIRLFAITTLEQITEDFPDHRGAVLALLSAFVRDNTTKWGDADPPQDVKEIFRILESELKENT